MKKWLNQEAIDVLCDYYYPRAKWLQDNVNWGQLDYEGPEANKIIDDIREIVTAKSSS